MLTLTDGRNKLTQWDTARKAQVTAECDRVHLANMEWGTAFVVDVVGGEIDIPDELLQSGAPLYAWAWVGSAEDGYTKQSGKIEVERRPKPSDYVFTPTEQESLKKIRDQIGDLDNLDTDVKQNLVVAINEVLSKFVETVGIVSIEQTTTSDEVGGINVITVTLTDGSEHEFTVRNGNDGVSPVISVSKSGKITTITITDASGTKTFTVNDGADGTTPHIGDNGNWWIGDTDTGVSAGGTGGGSSGGLAMELLWENAYVDTFYSQSVPLANNKYRKFLIQFATIFGSGMPGDSGNIAYAYFNIDDDIGTYWNDVMDENGEWDSVETSRNAYGIALNSGLLAATEFRTFEYNKYSNAIVFSSGYGYSNDDRILDPYALVPVRIYGIA